MTDHPAEKFRRDLDALIQDAIKTARQHLDRAGPHGLHPALNAYRRNVRIGCTALGIGVAGLIGVLANGGSVLLVAIVGCLNVAGLVATAFSIGGTRGYIAAARRAMQVITDRYREADSATWVNLPIVPGGHGYLYVIQFASGVVKAGQTTNPKRRLSEHRRDSRAYNIPMTNVWISAPHPDYLANEVRLLRAIAGDHDGDRAKREYFHGADFAGIVRLAQSLVGVSSGPVPVT